MSRSETPILELVESLVALRRTLRCVEQTGESSGSLGYAAVGVLAYVHRNQPTRATDIAQWIGIGPAALSRQVAELEGSGMLERRPSPTDARAQLISLTPSGTRETTRAYARRADLFAGLLEDWDETKVSAAAAILAEIQDVLRAGLEARGGKTTRNLQDQEEDIDA